jgi:CTP:molybdopterin cytidylyltransferase MocA
MSARRAALILAAGASERMGSPKALLPWGDSTLLDHALQEARTARVDDVVVVLGPATRHLDLGRDVLVAFNPQPDTGRSASIRLGSALLADDVAAVLVQSVDQPVSRDVVFALFEAVERGAEIAIPTFNGRRGHPVCVAGELLAELRAVTEEDQGLRAVIRRHAASVVEVVVEDEAVAWNLNDPAAYEAARAARTPS